MTESQWLKSKDGDAMLALVADRLSLRKWTLLACGVARQVLDLLPSTPYHAAVELIERDRRSPSVRVTWLALQDMEAALTAVVESARAKRRAILTGCDPDANGERFEDTVGRRTNPAVPLFEAASTNAGRAVELSGRAVEAAAEAVRHAFAGRGPDTLAQVRRSVIAVQVHSADAGIRSALALELKARGDETADRRRTRNSGVLLSEASNTADRRSVEAGHKIDLLEHQKVFSENLAFAELLREQLGNPFRPYRFEAKWRTETVVALASAIEAERAFDRMPILADALLDADCDEEAILRHCRQSEPHARGCWVLDLILDREPEMFAAEPLESRKRPMGRRQQLGRYTPPPEGMA